jgi:hypothetical protein
VLPKTISLRSFPMFSFNSFKVWGLTLISLIHLELIFVQGERQCSHFSILQWISNFPNTICWRDCLSLNNGFWCLCQKSNGCSCVGLFLDIVFISLIFVSILWQYHVVFVTMAL